LLGQVVNGSFGNEASLCALNPDGSLLVQIVPKTKQTPPRLRLWDLGPSSMQERSAIELERQPRVVRFSSDGSRLALGEEKENGGAVRLIDLERREPSLALPGNVPLNVTSLAFSPDGRYVAAAGNGPDGLVVWSLSPGGRRRAWPMPMQVRSLEFAADSRHLIVGNSNGSAYVLRLASPAIPSDAPPRTAPASR
jgi:WD40 repeat protein